MTVLKSETFESQGANGTTLSTTNSIFDALTQNFTVDSAIQTSGGGSHAGKVLTSTSVSALETATFTATDTPHFSFYFVADALPSANASIGQIKTSANALLAELRFQSNALVLRNSGSVLIATGLTLTAGEKCRINWSYDNVAGKQQLQMFVGANLEGTTPDYDSGLVTTTKAGTAARISIGVVTAAIATYRFDNFVIDNSAFAAPTGPPPNTPPTVNAGVDQASINPGQTVTITGTATDSDGTISSTSWTQTAGSPTVTLSGSGNTRTFTAPATSAGTTLTFQFSATDNSGATSTDTMTVTVLKASDFVMVSGAWVPAYWQTL